MMEDSYRSEERITRRKFLKIGGVVTAATFASINIGIGVKQSLEHDHLPMEELEFFGDLKKIEHSNNIHWKFYEGVVEHLYSSALEKDLPEAVLAVGFDIQTPDGSSVHLIKRESDISIEKRSFNDNSGQWESSSGSVEDFSHALQDALFMNVAYRTKEYEIDENEPHLQNLSYETRYDTGNKIQNVHQINLKRDYTRNLGHKLTDRRSIDSYIFPESSGKMTINSLIETTPNGFRSRDIRPTPNILLINENPIAVPEPLLEAVTGQLKEIFSP